MQGAFSHGPSVSSLLNISSFVSPQLDKEKLERIPILRRLRALEEQAGKDVSLSLTPIVAEHSVQTGSSMAGQKTREDPEGESKQGKRAQLGQKARQLPDRETKESRGADRTGKERGPGRKGDGKKQGPEEGGREAMPLNIATVYLRAIPPRMRVSELKRVLREWEAAPLKLTWQGAQHKAFLDYCNPQAAEHALKALKELGLEGYSLQTELAKSQRGDEWSGQSHRRQRPETTSSPDTKSNTNEMTSSRSSD